MGTVHDIYNSTYLSVCCALRPVLLHHAGPDATSDISLLPGFLVLLMECIIGRHEYITLGKDHYFSPCHRFYGSRMWKHKG